MTRPPPISPLFPHTTLSRSHGHLERRRRRCATQRPRNGEARPAAGRRRRHLVQHHVVAGRHRHLQQHVRSEEHTSELQSLAYLVCRLLLEKKNKPTYQLILT